MSSSSVGFQVSLIRFSSFGGQLPLFGDGAENRLFPFGYVAQLIVLLLDVALSGLRPARR